MVSTSPVSENILERYRRVRATTERLCAPLSAEDQNLQSMPDCSPVKWHRAHTTWFFETFILRPRGIAASDEGWGYLFNSYYEACGPRHLRPRRGLLSRPSVSEISAYRERVDERMHALLERALPDGLRDLEPLVELGMAHEEQHQELILTDVLHALSCHPWFPAYRSGGPKVASQARDTTQLRFVPHDGGLVSIGAQGSDAFCFDNEEPRHRVWLEPFLLGERLVTLGEWKVFHAAGGYRDARLWLSEGFEWARNQSIDAPLHTLWRDGTLWRFGLDGLRPARDDEPVTHVSYYEADAMARFFGARLPTEAEWEQAASQGTVSGNLLESGNLCALPAGPSRARGACQQLFGDAWEWTSSSYGPYPGYAPRPGALGEYNGKFMVNQMVLRGGSCFTPGAHVRASYRNFWHPHTRFQVTGIRLARDAQSVGGRT